MSWIVGSVWRMENQNPRGEGEGLSTPPDPPLPSSPARLD